jgi:hypothetical protein
MEKKDCKTTKKKSGNTQQNFRNKERERVMREKGTKQDAFIAIVAYINGPDFSLCSAVHYTIFNIKAPSLCC